METQGIGDIYIVCSHCQNGKRFNLDDADAQNDYAHDHLHGKIEMVPGQIFLSDWMARGYSDADFPDRTALPRNSGEFAISERKSPFPMPKGPKSGIYAEIQTISPEIDENEVKYTEITRIPRKIALRPSWDQTWMETALVMAKRGTCSRLKVGAVIVKDKRMISTGYNGAPSGLAHCNHDDGGDMIDGHCARAEHAERNALIFAGRKAKDATLYSTASPCLSCARLMVTVGLKAIIYLEKYRIENVVDDLCAEAGIIVSEMELWHL